MADNEDVDTRIHLMLVNVMKAKLKLAFLQREKRLLLEELHRQCLEGEQDPKKRLKPYLDKRKKQKQNPTSES